MGEQDGSLDERARPIPTEGSDLLLRAVDELRALEREKRLQAASSAPLDELERRVEEKARAVFRLAQQEGGDSPSRRAAGPGAPDLKTDAPSAGGTADGG